MPGFWTRTRLARAFAGGLLGITVVTAFAGTAARAQDDDDENLTIDRKIFRNIMGGIGLRDERPPIQYRERSPLVVPPANDLPPPESQAAITSNPAWPVDRDVKRQKEVSDKRKRTTMTQQDEDFLEGRTLRPGDLEPKGATQRPGMAPATRTIDSDSVMMRGAEQGNLQKGGASIWSKFGLKSFFSGVDEAESATFTTEPPRASLTEPPPGYRTPSPDQRYGLGKEAGPGATKYLDVFGRRE